MIDPLARSPATLKLPATPRAPGHQPLERPEDEIRRDVIVALVAGGARAEVGVDAVGSILLYEWLGGVRWRG